MLAGGEFSPVPDHTEMTMETTPDELSDQDPGDIGRKDHAVGVGPGEVEDQTGDAPKGEECPGDPVVDTRIEPQNERARTGASVRCQGLTRKLDRAQPRESSARPAGSSRLAAASRSRRRPSRWQ